MVVGTAVSTNLVGTTLAIAVVSTTLAGTAVPTTLAGTVVPATFVVTVVPTNVVGTPVLKYPAIKIGQSNDKTLSKFSWGTRSKIKKIIIVGFMDAFPGSQD